MVNYHVYILIAMAFACYFLFLYSLSSLVCDFIDKLNKNNDCNYTKIRDVIDYNNLHSKASLSIITEKVAELKELVVSSRPRSPKDDCTYSCRTRKIGRPSNEEKQNKGQA